MREDPAPEKPLDDEPFLSRWSRRKRASAEEAVAEALPAEIDPAQPDHPEEPPALTDADMPPLESLDENSDYTGFLSPEVSESLRQLALQKLFRSACFNVCDGLDDYAEDFTQFEKLGDVMTADLRFRLEQEARRMAEKAGAQSPDDAADEVPQASATASGEETDSMPEQPSLAAEPPVTPDPEHEEPIS